MKNIFKTSIFLLLLCLIIVPSLSAQQDSDGDGVPNAQDRCPNVAGLQQFAGCPDSDGDGFADPRDECPNVPGTINGCPDSDGDGFHDRVDRCPNIAGQFQGCRDTDGDGVLDPVDRCPNAPGPNQGCPEEQSNNGGGEESGGDSGGEDSGVVEEQSVAPTVPQDTCAVTPAGNRVNLRAERNTDSAILGVLEIGQLYASNGVVGQWAQVGNGWAFAGALTVSPACPVRQSEQSEQDNTQSENTETNDTQSEDTQPDNTTTGEQPRRERPDTDGDGVPDRIDNCAEEAGPWQNLGCPLNPDTDDDGIFDSADQCPTEAGPVLNSGCPLDDDGDGVYNSNDICPDEQGTLENDGCPQEPPTRICYGTRLWITHPNLRTETSVEFFIIRDGQRVSETATVILKQGEITSAELFLWGLETADSFAVASDAPAAITYEVRQLWKSDNEDECNRQNNFSTISHPRDNLSACYIVNLSVETILTDYVIIQFFGVTNTAIPVTDAIRFAIRSNGIQNYAFYIPGQYIPNSDTWLVVNFYEVDDTNEAVRVRSNSIAVTNPADCIDTPQPVPPPDTETAIVYSNPIVVGGSGSGGTGGTGGTGDGTGSVSYTVSMVQFIDLFGGSPSEIDNVEIVSVVIGDDGTSLLEYALLEDEDVDLRIEDEEDECVVVYQDVNKAEVYGGNPTLFPESCPDKTQPTNNNNNNDGFSFSDFIGYEPTGSFGEENNVFICPIPNGHEGDCQSGGSYLCIENWESDWVYDTYNCDLEEYRKQRDDPNAPWKADEEIVDGDSNTGSSGGIQGLAPPPEEETPTTVTWNRISNSPNFP